MKKIKLIASLAIASTLLFTGCASSFSEAIGNVTEESLKKSSFLTYKGKTISEKLATFVTYLEEFKVESSALQSDAKKLYDGSLWNQDSVKTTKEGVAAQLKNTLVLNANAKEYGVELSELEKSQIEKTVKTMLGQTYQNVLVEFFKDKGLPITEELLTEFLTNNAIAEKVQKEVMNKVEVNKNIEHAVGYTQIIVPTNNNAEGAKATADKIKEDIEGGKSIDSVVKDSGMTKLEAIEVKGIPSTYVSEDIHNQILNMSKDQTKVFEFKTGDKLVAYYVVKVTDVDSEQLKTKAQQSQIPILQQSKATEVINGWIAETSENKSVIDNIKYVTNASFWKQFDDSQLMNNQGK